MNLFRTLVPDSASMDDALDGGLSPHIYLDESTASMRSRVWLHPIQNIFYIEYRGLLVTI